MALLHRRGAHTTYDRAVPR